MLSSVEVVVDQNKIWRKRGGMVRREAEIPGCGGPVSFEDREGQRWARQQPRSSGWYRLHLARGDFHEAAGRATEAIRLDSQQPAAYLVRAEAHRRLKRPERAMRLRPRRGD